MSMKPFLIMVQHRVSIRLRWYYSTRKYVTRMRVGYVGLLRRNGAWTCIKSTQLIMATPIKWPNNQERRLIQDVAVLRTFASPPLRRTGSTDPRALSLLSPIVRAKTAYCISHKRSYLKDSQMLNGQEHGRASLMDKGTIDAFGPL